MELCACIEGVRAAEAVGVREIILETSLGDEFWVSVLGGVVHELKDLFAEHFILTQVKFIPREQWQIWKKYLGGARPKRARPTSLNLYPYKAKI
jgi:hypothetical protein